MEGRGEQKEQQGGRKRDREERAKSEECKYLDCNQNVNEVGQYTVGGSSEQYVVFCLLLSFFAFVTIIFFMISFHYFVKGVRSVE